MAGVPPAVVGVPWSTASLGAPSFSGAFVRGKFRVSLIGMGVVKLTPSADETTLIVFGLKTLPAGTALGD